MGLSRDSIIERNKNLITYLSTNIGTDDEGRLIYPTLQQAANKFQITIGHVFRIKKGKIYRTPEGEMRLTANG